MGRRLGDEPKTFTADKDRQGPPGGPAGRLNACSSRPHTPRHPAGMGLSPAAPHPGAPCLMLQAPLPAPLPPDGVLRSPWRWASTSCGLWVVTAGSF